MISIVMATYNGEKYVEKQLQSILMQTVKPSEVIIHDDCSEDKTVQVIYNFIKKNNLDNWKLSVNKQNEGYRKNFKNLLLDAKGDIIFFSDQDDEWNERKIELMSDAMRLNKNIKALNSGVCLINSNSEEIKVKLGKNSYNANFLHSMKKIDKLSYYSVESLLISNISPGCTMAITKELKEIFLKNYVGDMPHDWYLNILASIGGGCAFLNQELTMYRMHNNNTLGSATGKGLKASIRFFNQNERADEFQERLRALSNMEKSIIPSTLQLTYVRGYLKARMMFYQNPSVFRLFKLYRYHDYRERTQVKGKVWDILLSLRISKLIEKVC